MHNQLTLNCEPEVASKFNTLRDFMAYRIQVQAKPAKTIAADMDLSPSTLSRKLNPSEHDTQRFNIDDLENYIKVTGDTSAIEYLAAKYLCSDESRRARAIAHVETLSAELVGLMASIRKDDKLRAVA